MSGRELEIADLFAFIKRENIRNVHWITADLHDAATHRYNHAQFTEFLPFYEFVSGPLCAGGFGPNMLDKTFGPSVVFQHVPPAGHSDLAPSEGSCHFGHVRIDGKSGAMTVTHRDAAGIILHAIDLLPAWTWPVSTVFNRRFQGATRQKPDATAFSLCRPLQ